MRIAIIAIDTRGGVQPYVALGRGLQQAGHEVRLLAPAGFRSLVEPWRLDFRPLSGDVEAALRDAAGAAERGALATVRYARAQAEHHLRLWLKEADAHCADAELITGGIGGLVAGRAVSEKRGVPFVETHLQPLGQPTAAFPGPLLPNVPAWLGGFGKRLSHRLTALALEVQGSMGLAAARREVLGLPPRAAPLRTDLPVLYGYSRHVLPAPRDWDARRHVVGYWTLPPDEGWAPPPELARFLEAGPPPVCIGFGSMGSEDPRALARLVGDAVAQAGVRAVVLAGWGALEAEPRGDLLVLKEAPHTWLFPRMAGVVHHGGAGTTGAGLGAGVPNLVVPFTMDQPFWASRVYALGVGPRPIPRKRLDVAALAAGLRALVQDEAMRARARALGEAMRDEDGVAAAVAHFDRLKP